MHGATGLLHTALEKAKKPHCLPEHFSPEETEALQSHVVNRLADPSLSEGERAECLRMQSLLAHRQPQSHPEAPEQSDTESLRRRNNLTLRHAIERGMQGRAGELDANELRLLENTLRDLSAMIEPAANHLRLRRLVEQTLDAYYAHYAASVTGSKTAPAPREQPRPAEASEVTGIPCAEFFQGAQRQKVHALGPLPLGKNLYYYEHQGDLHLVGEIPEDSALIIHEGGLKLSGSSGGMVQVEGDIQVSGNVSGGVLLSASGQIEVGRVLAGSRVIALRGGVRCAAVERASLLYCAESLSVAGAVQDSRILCRSASVHGTISRGRIGVMESLNAVGVMRDSTNPPIVERRALISVLDLGGELEDHETQSLKEAARTYFEVVQAEAIDSAFQRDFVDLQRALLFLVQSGGGASEAQVSALRDLQSARAYSGILLALADALIHSTQRYIELPGIPDVLVLVPALDVCQRVLRNLKAESEALPQDLVPQRRQKIASAISQLANLAKQARDSNGSASELAGLIVALRDRAQEWRSEANSLNGQIEEALQPLKQSLSEDVMAETRSSDLAAQVKAAIEKGATLRSRLMPPLKKCIEHYGQGAAKWGGGLAEARAKLKQAQTLLEETGSIHFTRTSDVGIIVGGEGMGEGAVIAPLGFSEPLSAANKGLVHIVSATRKGAANFKIMSASVHAEEGGPG